MAETDSDRPLRPWPDYFPIPKEALDDLREFDDQWNGRKPWTPEVTMRAAGWLAFNSIGESYFCFYRNEKYCAWWRGDGQFSMTRVRPAPEAKKRKRKKS